MRIPLPSSSSTRRTSENGVFASLLLVSDEPTVARPKPEPRGTLDAALGHDPGHLHRRPQAPDGDAPLRAASGDAKDENGRQAFVVHGDLQRRRDERRGEKGSLSGTRSGGRREVQ